MILLSCHYFGDVSTEIFQKLNMSLGESLFDLCVQFTVVDQVKHLFNLFFTHWICTKLNVQKLKVQSLIILKKKKEKDKITLLTYM